MTQILRAVRESTLTANQRLVTMTIASLADTRTGMIPEQYRPTPEDLVRDTGLSRATVYRCIGDIADAGWIERERLADRTTRVVAALVPVESQGETEDDVSESPAEIGQSHSETGGEDQSHSETGESPTETKSSHTENDTYIHGSYGTKEPSSSAKSRKAKKLEPQRDDVDQICGHLAARIEANGSLRPPINEDWKQSARLLLDKDGRTVDQVIKAIDWSQSDWFWHKNILSMPTLREKYDRLRLEAAAELKSGARRTSNGHHSFRNPTDPSAYEGDL